MSKGLVTVIDKIQLRKGSQQEAGKLYDEWCQFLKKIPGFHDIEQLCFTEDRLVWLERWDSKETLDAFHLEHMTLSDFSIRMLECSRVHHERKAYQEIK